MLARISTELKSLGEEYARKEQIRIQKTATGTQLENLEGISLPPPKENIGPGQSCPRPRRTGEGAPLPAKASSSGILQQRAKTLIVANLPSSSRKKQKSSASGSAGPLRPVSKPKGFRRSKTHETAMQNSSGSADSGFIEENSVDLDAKTPPSMELCATPKRLKVSAKGSSGKVRRKQAAWAVKSVEGEEKTEVPSESSQLLWASNRNPPPQIVSKKALVASKLEKTSRSDSKFRPGVFTKVKAVKKLSQADASCSSENTQLKLDEPQIFTKLVDRVPGSKNAKLSITETLKPNSNATVSKEWLHCKNSARNLLFKAGKVDLTLPGPSSGNQSEFTGNQLPAAGPSSRVEQKIKSSVLRSLEKGTKSRLLCPVRRRSSDGKKSRKNMDRKPVCTAENNVNMTPVCPTRNDIASDNNCAN